MYSSQTWNGTSSYFLCSPPDYWVKPALQHQYLHVSALLIFQTHCCFVYYPHMLIGKVWIYWLLFVCLCVCVCVCIVTNFSSGNKASGVKFCTEVHRRSRQRNLPFWGISLPRSPKSDESASAQTKHVYGTGGICQTERRSIYSSVSARAIRRRGR